MAYNLLSTLFYLWKFFIIFVRFLLRLTLYVTTVYVNF